MSIILIKPRDGQRFAYLANIDGTITNRREFAIAFGSTAEAQREIAGLRALGMSRDEYAMAVQEA